MLILEIALGIILALILLRIGPWLLLIAVVAALIWFIWGAASSISATYSGWAHRVFVEHQWEQLWAVGGVVLIVLIAAAPLLIRDRLEVRRIARTMDTKPPL